MFLNQATSLSYQLVLLTLAVSLVFGGTSLYPYGSLAGDRESEHSDDSCGVSYSRAIHLFETQYSTIYVCTNGLLSLGNRIITYTPSAFPLSSSGAMIAAYWADADPRRGAGTVWSRETTDSLLLYSASKLVEEAYNIRFLADWGLVATWSRVQPYDQGSTDTGGAENTFQLVLMSNGVQTYALYLYEVIVWTTGTASSGTAAQVGFDAGNGENFLAVQASRTPSIVNVDTGSNIGKTGKWLFKLTNTQVEAPVINECEEHIDDCDINAFCTDQVEGYNCTCNEGYTGDGEVCYQIVNECERDLDDCHDNATCTDLVAGYECSCNTGLAGDGFSCTEVNDVCLAANRVGEYGILTSPNFPLAYNNSIDCSTVITVPSGVIGLNFTTFSTEPCCDFVRVIDARTGENIETLGGEGLFYRPLLIDSVRLQFHTNGGVTRGGWQLVWFALPDPAITTTQPVATTTERTGNHELIGTSGTVTSPGYPNNYPSNALVNWTITVEPGLAVHIVFADTFGIEQSRDCRYDSIMVYEGLTGRLLLRRCGRYNETSSVTSTTNIIIIVFRSDASQEGAGFSINWAAVEQPTITPSPIQNEAQLTGQNGTISLPSSWNGNNFTWTITTNSQSVVRIEIPSNFETPFSTFCGTNVISIIDGRTNSLLFTVCDSTVERRIFVGTSNILVIFFHTESSLDFPMMVWNSIPPLSTEYELAGSSGVIVIPSYQQYRLQEANYRWTISVDLGSVVRTTFSNGFNVFPSDGCSRDGIKIYDGLTDVLLFSLCEYISSGRSFIGTTNILVIVFHTENGFQFPGMTWDSLLLTDECEVNTHDCDSNAYCTDLIQGYNCTCNERYDGDGMTCTLDECRHGLHNCHSNATCTDATDGYSCRCDDGFSGDGYTCYEDDTHCPSGKEYNPFSEECLSLITDAPRGWNSAKDYCKQAGGNLAVFDTVDSIQWLKNIRQTNANWKSAGSLWIDGKKVSDGKWRWLGGTNKLMQVAAWAHEMPNGSGNCVQVDDNTKGDNSYLWEDVPCNTTLNFVCQ